MDVLSRWQRERHRAPSKNIRIRQASRVQRRGRPWNLNWKGATTGDGLTNLARNVPFLLLGLQFCRGVNEILSTLTNLASQKPNISGRLPEAGTFGPRSFRGENSIPPRT